MQHHKAPIAAAVDAVPGRPARERLHNAAHLDDRPRLDGADERADHLNVDRARRGALSARVGARELLDGDALDVDGVRASEVWQERARAAPRFHAPGWDLVALSGVERAVLHKSARAAPKRERGCELVRRRDAQRGPD